MPPDTGGIPGRIHFSEVTFAFMLSPGRLITRRGLVVRISWIVTDHLTIGGTAFEPELDPFLQFAYEIGHVTPDIRARRAP